MRKTKAVRLALLAASPGTFFTASRLGHALVAEAEVQVAVHNEDRTNLYRNNDNKVR